MKFISKFLNKKKLSVYKTKDSYKDILYKSEDNKVEEIIFNRTNLKAPKYVVSIGGTQRLYYFSCIGDNKPNAKPIPKSREIVYKTPEEFVSDRVTLLKFYWESNFNSCRSRYSSYEEFVAISCSSMYKPRTKVVINE